MPPKSLKRKLANVDDGDTIAKRSTVTSCILHVEGIQTGEFTPLSNVKGSSATDKLVQLHGICERRLKEPKDSPYRMDNVCSQIPENLEGVNLDTVGYHRGCYQQFTKNLDRLKGNMPTRSTSNLSRSPRKTPMSSTAQKFPETCIFCDKCERKKPAGKSSRKTERCALFAVFKNERGTIIDATWKQIEPRALALGENRLHRMVQGQDLFAREAMYHPSCRQAFNLRYLNHIRSAERAQHRSFSNAAQDSRADAHAKAFNAVLDFIQENVITEENVVQLASLRWLYIQELERNGFPNPEYRSEKLKARLENHKIKELINFAKANPGDKGCIVYSLVYSSSMSVEDAVAHAYLLGSRDQYEDVALLLRRLIHQAFKNCKSLPWPPTADDLDITYTNGILPEELVKFLSFVIAGNKDLEDCEKAKRVVLSIGQDICRAATKGEWKLPKHILLCTTLRHLYRSKQLTTIISRLGHCETYDFGLELETALAKALDEVSTALTPQIITGEGNEVFHLEWDNMNKTTTNIHGSNVVNSTAGIMIQEVKPGYDTNDDRKLPLYNRSKSRSLSVDTPESLPTVHIYNNRVGPKLPERATFKSPLENDAVYKKSANHYYVWQLARIVGSCGEKQFVPGLGGFISATGTAPKQKSTIEYFTPINQPFTEYSVIKELLKRSEDATREVGQEYVLNTFDLGGCMKALPLIWKFPAGYEKHVVIPGPFHTAMNYMGMITANKCKGSGYSEILIEAGLVTSGCLKNVLKGKAYAKALFCLKTVTEAMERLLFERFVDEEEVTAPIALLNLVQNLNRENLDLTLQDRSTIALLEKYMAYKQRVRNGHLGKTARFWVSVMDHAVLVFMLQYSVKTNNFSLFHKCNGEMAALFFAFDGPNYSRYLVWFDLFLNNIDKSHPGAKELLQKGGIAVARSLIPGALSAVDKTMEETFMKFAKSAGGFSGLFSMFGAYQRWCRTTSTRAQYYEKMLETCGLIDDPECPKAGKHRELEKAEIKKSENAVQRTISAIRNFTDPFCLADKQQLYSIASGAPVPLEAETDVLRAEEIGEKAKQMFIKDRFINGSPESLFFEPIKRQKLKTMEASNKMVKLTASQGKVIQYREQSDLAFMLLVKSQHIEEPIDLDELMTYPLTPVPHSLGTPDGFFNKTNKATILHYLMEDVENDVPYPTDSNLFIQDGNALFHAMLNLPPTFGEICLQILDQMAAKKDFIFSTDSYHDDSIKSQERLRRGFSQRYIVDGAATRKPTDFKLFLANDDNKRQLCHLLLKVWGSSSAASRISKCGRAVTIVDGKAYMCQMNTDSNDVSTKEIFELASNQEETDTRVVLYIQYAASQGYKSVVVRTPDTDIFVILLHYAPTIPITIYLDTGVGKHRKIVNVSELATSKGQEYATMLMGVYVFTGEDVTSAFKGKGKLGPLKKLLNNPKYQETFRKLGDDWSIEDKTMQELEEFTCIMYGYKRESSVNAVRAMMLKKMVGENESMTKKSKIDLSRLPPCQDNLIPHIHRVNHRLAIYKKATVPIFWRPKPYDEGQGWEKTERGILEPIWSCGPILPTTLIDLIDSSEDDCSEDESSEVEELDYDEFSDEDDE